MTARRKRTELLCACVAGRMQRFVLLFALLASQIINGYEGQGYDKDLDSLAWNSANVGESLRKWLQSCRPSWIAQHRKEKRAVKPSNKFITLKEILDDDAEIQGGCEVTNLDDDREEGGLPFLGELNPYLKPDKDKEDKEPSKFDFSYYGGFDSEGLLHGNAMLVVKNHTKGVYNFVLLDNSPGLAVEELRATFHHGFPRGNVWIRCRDGSVIRARFDGQGRLSGRLILIVPKDDDDDYDDDDGEDWYYVRLIAGFRRGRYVGPAWVAKDPNWQSAQYFEDENLTRGAYLYPDMETALVGSFSHGLLSAGVEATVVMEVCDSTSGVKIIRFEAPESNEGDPVIYRYDPPSHYRFGDDPTVEDPYEKKHVQLRKVKIDSETGTARQKKADEKEEPYRKDNINDLSRGVEEEGLFAKKRISKGSFVAFYSGLVVPCSMDFWALKEGPEPTETENDARNAYLMSLVKREKMDLCIDIPPEYGRNTSLFKATKGHKVNHSFWPNAAFADFRSHPRYGRIMSLVALRDIEEGEQITSNYNYGKEDGSGPQWYQAALKIWKEKKRKEESSDVTVDEKGGRGKQGGKFDGHIPKREEEEKRGPNTPHSATTATTANVGEEVSRMPFKMKFEIIL